MPRSAIEAPCPRVDILLRSLPPLPTDLWHLLSAGAANHHHPRPVTGVDTGSTLAGLLHHLATHPKGQTELLVETEADVASSPGEEGSRTDRTLSTGGDGGGSADRRDSADNQHRVPAADRQERYRRAPSRTASPRSLLPRG